MRVKIYDGSKLLHSERLKPSQVEQNLSNDMAGPNTASKASFIPIIDFSPFLHSKSHDARSATAKAILDGFRSTGFIYLADHGIPLAQIASMFATSAQFFTRPQQSKDSLAWTTAESNRGYVCMGREKVSHGMDVTSVEASRAAEGEDLKESFEVGREGQPGFETPWPSDDGYGGAEFRATSLEFFETCKQLHVELMRAIALGLGIDEHWFDPFTDVGDNTLRLLHYPEVPKNVFKQNRLQVRAGAHSDYGSVTLLFQDRMGGLQVQSPDGTFVDATPINDTIVINAGDLLARWSNDMIKSTVHRVVEPPAPEEGDVHPARYSIAYFCNPNFDRLIETIPKTIAPGEARKYPSVNSGDYLVQRLTATF